MIYKIVVDKQPRTNPSAEKREYEIDIEELRTYRGVYDSLVITVDEDYVMRRISVNELNAMQILQTPVKEPLNDINIALFDGNNYIYLANKTGNKIYAEYLVKNEFNQLYVTKIEMNTSIEQTASSIMLVVNKKVDGEEFGTYIEQNSESVKFAWNQISEFIQMMIINGKASLAILDENENKLMSLDNQGQHFFKDGQNSPFGEMGVQTVDQDQYIAFSVNGAYESSINNGMAWGIKTIEDDAFYPILFIRNFQMGAKNSDTGYGELELDNCDLILGGTGAGIISGGIKIFGDPGFDRLYFYDVDNQENLMTISTESFDSSIKILDKIEFFKNQAGTNSFRVGDQNTACVLTDTGSISGEDIYSAGEIYAAGDITGQDVTANGDMYAHSFVNTSLEESKKNFEELTDKEALEIIKNTNIYKYNMKEEDKNKKKHIGFVIGKKYKYSNAITAEDKEGKEVGADTYSMISAAYKVIQMQQKKIEELEKRIEKLEKGDK